MTTKGDTFVSLFDESRRANPLKECYVTYDLNMKRSSMTFQEMWTLSARFAYILKQHGVQRGDYVVVTTPLSLEAMVATFGVILAGGSEIPMEKLFQDCLMTRETLKLSKSKIMVVPDDACELWDYFKKNAKGLSYENMSAEYKDSENSLRKILFSPRRAGPWKSGFLEHLRKCTKEFVDTGLTPQDGAISCASLNPGIAVPKLVEHSHGSIISMARKWTKSVEYTKVHFLYPLYINGALPYDILFGTTRVITDFFEAPITNITEHIIAVTKAEKLAFAVLIPVDVAKLVEKLKPTNDLPLAKTLASGGMPMSNAFFEIARQLVETVVICYLSSEAGIISLNKLEPGDGFTPFDCGPPVEGVQIRVVNDKHEDVSSNQTGTLILKSNSLFLRYIGEPEKTKSMWTQDGWFLTGDAGCMGSDGNLHVFGRKTDAISRGIVFTYPAWLEKPILTHRDVLETIVVGVPDVVNYMCTCACVVKRPGSPLTEKAILDLVQDSMTKDGSIYFVLDYVVFFDKALPTTNRDELAKVAAQKLGLN